MLKTKKNKGFTLVEISIVLVIIGLIVSGVLIGQELVKSAEIRSLITQVENYNTSVYAFKDKFGSYPGDFSRATTMLGSRRDGDGNGMIHNAAGAPGANPATSVVGEIISFWEHLSLSGLSDTAFVGALPANIRSRLSAPDQTFPALKSNASAGIVAYAGTDFINYYHLGITTNTASNALRTADALTPDAAFNFDQKTDDGIADTGSVTARGGTALEAAASTADNAGENGCVITSSIGSYNAAKSRGYACQLRVRMQ